MVSDTKRLIEVTFPLKKASLDSVHEKNVRHGHISTLHIWPARRPLAASRAALIATLLPDPGDLGHGRLCRHLLRDGYGALAGERCAWGGYRLAVVYAPRDRFFQRILGLGQSLGLVGPRRETLRQVAE